MTGRFVLPWVLATTWACVGNPVTHAAELAWTGRAGVASGLVYRGISLSNRDVVPNLDVAVEHDSGLFANGWLTRVEFPAVSGYPEPYTDPYIDTYTVPYPTRSADTEWQLMAGVGYRWRPGNDWAVSGTHSWFRYPGEDQDYDPDYREYGLTVEYRGHLLLDYAYADDLWGLGIRQSVVSLTGRWSFSPRLLAAGTAGWADQRGAAGDSYSYLQLNLGYLIEDWSVQLQFHHSSGWDTLYPGDPAEREWVVQLNWHW